MGITQPSGSSAIVRIAGGALGAATASIDITSIPTGYTRLVLELSQVGVSASDYIKIRFNADAGTHYEQEAILSAGAGAPTGFTNNSDCLNATGSFENNNDGAVKLVVYNCTGAYVKAYTYELWNQSAGHQITLRGNWSITSEINQITITAQAGNLNAGLKYTLLGYY
ncbi:MAG: hypothetical protein NTU93_18635 [Arthrobacter sp.]|nr:hypothetical protein [Arthrobacter sp.]